MQNSDGNDIDERACPFVASGNVQLKKDREHIFEDHQNVVKYLKGPIASAFQLPAKQIQKFDFKSAAVHSDTIVSRYFEGLPISKDINKEQLRQMFGMNKRSQLGKYPADSKRVWATQMLERPINIVDSIVNQAMEQAQQDNSLDEKAPKSKSLLEMESSSKGTSSKRHKHTGAKRHNHIAYMSESQWSKLTHPKYMMYSTHDTQLAVVWEFLDPKNYDPLYIPYASFIQMELYKD